MKTPRVVLIALVSLAVAVPSSLFACGKERWLVKVGEDKDVARVNITVQKTNIAKLVQIGAPINPNIRKDTRYKQTPNSVYATVTGVAFFDKIHGQTGVAPNGIELHPILHVDLRNAP